MSFTATGQFEELVIQSLSLVRDFRGVVPHYGASRLSLQDLRQIRELSDLHVQRRATASLYQIFPAEDGRPGSRCVRLQSGLPVPLDVFLVLALCSRFRAEVTADLRSVHEVVALLGIFNRAERKQGGRRWIRQQKRALRAMGEDWYKRRLPALLFVAQEVARRLHLEDALLEARTSLEEGVSCREATRYSEACRAFRRAILNGKRSADFEAVALGRIGLAYTLKFQGKAEESEVYFLRALNTADRRGLQRCRAYALHGLATLAIEAADAELANSRARAAFEMYEQGDQHVVALVHDIAFLWLEQGYALRALTVFRACAPRLAGVAHLVALSSVARAAAVVKAVGLAEAAWWKVWSHVSQSPVCHKTAQAYFNLGVAAQVSGHWSRAEFALKMALQVARARGERALATSTGEVLLQVQARTTPPAHIPPAQSEIDAFARTVVSRLELSTKSGAMSASGVPG